MKQSESARILSLDLRGFGTPSGLSGDRPARGAQASALLHALGLSALAFIPLLGGLNAPDAAGRVNALLIEPVLVTPPPPPPPVGRSRAQASASPLAEPRATPPLTPPLSAMLVSIDDANALVFAPQGVGVPGPTGVEGGDCALGAICGDAPLPRADTNEIPRVGGLIKEPRLLESRPPEFPPFARQAGVSGRVVIDAHVGRDGKILQTTIVEGNTLFNDAALSSVRSRRYDPLHLNGVPTDFMVTITIKFTAMR